MMKGHHQIDTGSEAVVNTTGCHARHGGWKKQGKPVKCHFNAGKYNETHIKIKEFIEYFIAYIPVL